MRDSRENPGQGETRDGKERHQCNEMLENLGHHRDGISGHLSGKEGDRHQEGDDAQILKEKDAEGETAVG